MAGLRAPLLACALALAIPLAAQDSRPATRPAKPKPTQAKPWTLDRLLKAFKGLPGLSAEFKEEKRLALLAEPLVNEGTIHFMPPLTMARHTTKPARSSVLIEKDRLQVSDGARSESIPLDRHPVVRQLVNGFLPVLQGDREALERHYRVTFALRPKVAGGWTLKLVPKGGVLKKAIAKITFVGTGLVFDSMRIDEVGGDATLTTFKNVDVRKRYSAKEAKRVFAIPAAKKKKRG